jgi:hypothetical protein
MSAASLVAVGSKTRVAFINAARAVIGADRTTITRPEVVKTLATDANLNWPSWLTGDLKRRSARGVFDFSDMLVDPATIVPEPVKVPKVKAPKAPKAAKAAPEPVAETFADEPTEDPDPDAIDQILDESWDEDELTEELEDAAEVESVLEDIHA